VEPRARVISERLMDGLLIGGALATHPDLAVGQLSTATPFAGVEWEPAGTVAGPGGHAVGS
jgi:hypothetical protein